MKHTYIFIASLAVLASCQPHFDMVPPPDAAENPQEFIDNWFVSRDGSGTRNGADWDNSMPFADFINLLGNTTTNLSDAGIHIKEGVYVVSNEANSFLRLTKDILCVRGGYNKDLESDDLSKCDPSLYPTIFSGDVNGDGEANTGDAGFAYVTNGNSRFENITFKNFYLSSAMVDAAGAASSAVFGINGPYLTTSVECNRCIFEGNVNGVAGTTAQEGGPAAFVTKGYFKARQCEFRDNSGNSRGGALRTNDKQGIIFLDRCLFRGNTLTGGNFGTAIQCSSGVVCMNNCTMLRNNGNGATLNGGGAFFVANSTLIDDCSPDGTTNAAFRCESKAESGSVIINSVFTTTSADGYGILLNSNGGTLLSKGYNVIKSVFLGHSSNVDPATGNDTKKDIVLAGEFSEGVFQWNIDQLGDDLKGLAVEDDVYSAAVAFNPVAYCEISVLGRAYATWVTPLAFTVDARGEDRGEDGYQPGAYDPNLD